MKKYLIPEDGNFYKSNLHCHSDISDGSLSCEEIKKIYKEKGYSIVAYTDHDVLLDHSDLNDESFLTLNGFEIEVNEEKEGPFYLKKSTHMCFIALDKDNLLQPCYHRTKYFVVEAALLLEDHYDVICDELWYIHTDEAVRAERLKKARGYDDEKIASICANQKSPEEFRNACDVTIDNSGVFADTCRQIDEQLGR